MKRVKTFLIRGQRWKLKWRRSLSFDGHPADGLCDPKTGTVHIDPDLEPERLLDVTIHEALHAAYPDLSERAVEDAASDLARLLWRLGYRQEKPV